MAVRSKKQKYIDTIERNVEQCIMYLNRDHPVLWPDWIQKFIKLIQENPIEDIGALFDYDEEIALFLASKLGIRQDNKYQYRYYEKKGMNDIVNTINKRLNEAKEKDYSISKKEIQYKIDDLIFNVRNRFTDLYPLFLNEWVKMNRGVLPKTAVQLSFIKEKLGIDLKDKQFDHSLITLYKHLTAYD